MTADDNPDTNRRRGLAKMRKAEARKQREKREADELRTAAIPRARPAEGATADLLRGIEQWAEHVRNSHTAAGMRQAAEEERRAQEIRDQLLGRPRCGPIPCPPPKRVRLGDPRRPTEPK